MKYLFVILCSVFVLAGCATSPVSVGDAVLVSESDVYNKSITNPSNGSVVVRITRDSGIFGSGCSSKVYIDGSHIANLGTGEYVKVYLKSGRHIISAQPTTICAGGLYETQFEAQSGESFKYRIGIGTNGDYFIVPTAF